MTPSKRPNDWSLSELNGKGKRPKMSDLHSQVQSLKSTPDSIIRLLCPASKIGSIIGKGGSVISHIRQETGAKVRVEDVIPGCDERVIVIMGSDKEEGINDQSENGGEETNVVKEDVDIKEHDKDDEDKVPAPVEVLKSEKVTSGLQKALFLIFERMTEGETGIADGDEESNKPSSSVVRLLVLSAQVGCLLGKGGNVIKQMSSDSGAQIRILPKDKLPAFASASDDLVQIAGGMDAVRKALQSVSQQLLDNPPRENDTVPASSSGSSFGQPISGPRDFGEFHPTGLPMVPRFHDTIPNRMKPPQDALTFRLLCHNDRVGGIIGKGGTVVRTLQNETGCEIKVLEGGPGAEDRIIAISGPSHPDDRISPTQDAVLRVHSRIIRSVPDGKEASVTARLLVSSNQIGCLLGKGGSIIAEMRKSSGAYIRILGKDHLPKVASENEEVVQISGEQEVVQDALLQITSRLRHHFFRDAFPPMNLLSNTGFQDQFNPFPPHVGRREFSPPGTHSSLGPQLHKFDSIGGLPRPSGFYPNDERPPFFHNIYRSDMPPLIPERKPALWGPQGLSEGSGPRGLPDLGGAPIRRFAGLGGGNQPPFITSTTIEVVVPRSAVPSIRGEDDGCLKQICEISDAKVTITEPKPRATETVIIISGTPEETHAAQSLIQAFVISESDSA